jgi:hypothetical protein
MTASVQDYVANIEEACGEEKDYIVVFRYEKKEEAIAKILKNAKLEKSISRIAFELTFRDASIRLYGTGKAIFRHLKGKEKLDELLTELLL